MPKSRSFRINDKHVAHEAFEDEVLAINLDTGTYYSLPGVSAHIWACLVGGATIEAVGQSLGQLYDGDSSLMNSAIIDFIAKMHAENLILSYETSENLPDPQLSMANPSRNKGPFVSPIMEIYSDMQDLLVLDPIHCVDDAGWPTANPLVTREAKT